MAYLQSMKQGCMFEKTNKIRFSGNIKDVLALLRFKKLATYSTSNAHLAPA